MTKLSISLAAAMLSVTFAPAANAYSFEPNSDANVALAVSAPQAIADADICVAPITPLLASILALPDDLRGQSTPTQTALACAEE